MAWYNSVSIKKLVFLFLFSLPTPSRPDAHILPGFCCHSLLGTGGSPCDSPFVTPPLPSPFAHSHKTFLTSALPFSGSIQALENHLPWVRETGRSAGCYGPCWPTGPGAGGRVSSVSGHTSHTAECYAFTKSSGQGLAQALCGEDGRKANPTLLLA